MAMLVTCGPGATLIDYSWARIDYASAVNDHGYEGVLGYLPWDGNAVEEKCLNKSLIAEMVAAGMCWAGIWELSANRALQGYDVGLSDGRYACRSALTLGAPAGATVYYAVDFDATPWTVQEYGKGFRDACTENGMVSGVYGGVRVIDYMVGTMAINPYGWQTEAWSYGRVSDCAHILQRTYVKPIPGTDHNDVLKPIIMTGDPSNNPPIPEGEDMSVLVLSDSGTIYIVDGCGKCPIQGHASWADTAWSIEQLVNNKVVSGYVSAPQGALNILPDRPPPTGDLAAQVLAELEELEGLVKAIPPPTTPTSPGGTYDVTGRLNLTAPSGTFEPSVYKAPGASLAPPGYTPTHPLLAGRQGPL